MKLAILGASYLQVPLIRKANEMGLETHVFAWEEGAVGKELASYFYPISILDKEAILLKCLRKNINMIEKLEWDSAFFGINIGRLIINDEKDFDAKRFNEDIKASRFDLVYIFKFQKMLSWDITLDTKLQLLDIQTTMSMKFENNSYKNLEYKLINELSLKEKNESYKIAEETAQVSRFYNESLIGIQKTKDLYRKWIDNALNKSYSDGIFLEKESDSVSGIHLIKTDNINKIGYFTLTGVNSNFKRMGIGRKLWLQSFGYWANESDIEIVKSPFSYQNSESLNFHLKVGFNKVEEIKYIYHFKNELL